MFNMTAVNNAIKAFVVSMNKNGIPMPMVRDPHTGEASFTLTMTLISFNTALLGQIGKLTQLLGPVDLSQANYLFLMCLGAYLGRKMQGSSATKTVSMEAEDGSKN